MAILSGKAFIHKDNFRRNILPLLLLSLLFIAWRLCFFTFTHPHYFQDSYEEIHRGTVAREILSGSALPLWEYRPDNYAGGFYVMVYLVAASFLVFGYKILALKAVAILLMLGTMLLWYHILSRYAGRKIALIFSLLFIFSPFHVISLTSNVLGDHAETLFLTALTIALFFETLHTTQKHPAMILGLGLLAGFGIWFSYIYAITLFTLFLFTLIHVRVRLNTRNTGIFLISFLTGLSFWIIFNIKTRFSGFIVRGAPIWEFFNFSNLLSVTESFKNTFIGKILENLKPWDLDFFTQGILVGLYGILGSGIIIYSIFTLFFMKSKPSFKERLKTPKSFALIYLLIFIFLQQSAADSGLRFLIPGVPFFLAVTASGLSRIDLHSNKWSRLLLFILIALGIASVMARFTFDFPGEYLNRKGYSYKTLGFSPNARTRLEYLLTHSEALRPKDRTAITRTLASYMDLDHLPDEIVAVDKMLPPLVHDAFYYFLGRDMMVRLQDYTECIKRTEFLKATQARIHEQILVGIIHETVQNSAFADQKSVEEWRKVFLPEHLRYVKVIEGYKFAVKNLETSSPHAIPRILGVAFTGETDEEKKFLEGIGKYYFEYWAADPNGNKRRIQKIEDLPAPLRHGIFFGIGKRLTRSHIRLFSTHLIWQWRALSKILNRENMFSVYEGMRGSLKKTGIPIPVEEFFPRSLYSELKSYEDFESI